MRIEISRQIFGGAKETQMSNLMKTRPVVAELFDAGGQEMTKVTVALFFFHFWECA